MNYAGNKLTGSHVLTKLDCELFELNVGADFVTSGAEILSVDVNSEG